MKCVIIAAGKGERLQEKGTSKPLVNFLGLPLIERTIRTAKKAGANEFFVVTGHEKDPLEAILKKLSEDTGLVIHTIYNSEWENGANGFSVLSVKDKIKEPFLLLMSDHLFDPSIVRNLFSQSNKSDVVLAIDTKIKNPMIALNCVTKVKVDNNKITKIGKNLKEYDGFDTGIFYCKPSIFKALEICIKKDMGFLTDAIQYLADKSKVNIFKIDDKFWADVNDPESYRKAESEVLKNLNKQHDGIIARYFNRPISIWISKKLSVTNITPNQISIFAFSVACIASLLFAMGSYIPLIIGGILAQISSIIDGCDGEVARLKYQESSYGGWFDAVLVKQSCIISGTKGIALTKIDVLDEFKNLYICVAYKLNGKKIDYLPADLQNQLKVKPIYKRFDGWLKNTKGIKKWKDLPKNAQKYINFIKDYCGVKISSISTSPKREDTILLDNPFKKG